MKEERMIGLENRKITKFTFSRHDKVELALNSNHSFTRSELYFSDKFKCVLTKWIWSAGLNGKKICRYENEKNKKMKLSIFIFKKTPLGIVIKHKT
jgi:hypothetical protein